jgi:hypothetical protein
MRRENYVQRGQKIMAAKEMMEMTELNFFFNKKNKIELKKKIKIKIKIKK